MGCIARPRLKIQDSGQNQNYGRVFGDLGPLIIWDLTYAYCILLRLLKRILYVVLYDAHMTTLYIVASSN